MPFVARHACFHVEPQPNPAFCHGKYEASGWFLVHRWPNSTEESPRGQISSLLETLDVFIIHQWLNHDTMIVTHIVVSRAQVPAQKLITIDIHCWKLLQYNQKNFAWMCVSNGINCRIQNVGDQILDICSNLPSCHNVCCQIHLNFIILIIVGNQNLIDVQTMNNSQPCTYAQQLPGYLVRVVFYLNFCIFHNFFLWYFMNTSIMKNTFWRVVNFFITCCNVLLYSMECGVILKLGP